MAGIPFDHNSIMINLGLKSNIDELVWSIYVVIVYFFFYKVRRVKLYPLPFTE